MSVRDPMGEPFRDLVIAIPGILGTELLKDGKREWGLSSHAVVKNLITGGRHLARTLAVPLGSDPAEFRGDGVKPGSVIKGLAAIPGLGGVDLYGSLERALRAHLALAPQQLAWFGYDWRLSCRVSGAALVSFIERRLEEWRRESRFASARVVLVAHSMGGLVAQWASIVLRDSDVVRHVVTIGTPFKGSAEAITTLVNGGRFAQLVEVAAFARSLPSMYELIPQYQCVGSEQLDSGHAGERPTSQGEDRRLRGDAYLLDVLDNPDLRARVSAASLFHDSLRKGEEATAAKLICFRGVVHDTATFLRSIGARLEGVTLPRGGFGSGDGVVPSDSAIPASWTRPELAKFVSQRHTTLAGSTQIGPELAAALRHSGRLMAVRPVAGVTCPNTIMAGDDLTLTCSVADHSGSQLRPSLTLTLVAVESKIPPAVYNPAASARGYIFRIGVLKPGLYRWTIAGPESRPNVPDPVSDYLAVLGDK